MTEETQDNIDLTDGPGVHGAEWPSHVPVGCPPPDAADLSGTVFMLVATDPPTPRDMVCAMERHSFRNKPPCLRAALSCARDAEHLRELRQGVPRLAKHLVARAALTTEHGKIKQTGRQGHYSMWLRARYLGTVHSLFEVLQ